VEIGRKHIAEKSMAGKTSDGYSVIYIKTHGGLHSFWVVDINGGIIPLSASPHKAISKFLAEKSFKGAIDWED